MLKKSTNVLKYWLHDINVGHSLSAPGVISGLLTKYLDEIN